MRILSVVEQLLLLLEKRKQPMHVGGLFLFEIPDSANRDFVAKLVQQLEASTTPPSFPFNQVLHKHTFWKTSTNFAVHRHLHHVKLSTTNHSSSLLDYISNEHARPLDKSQPLWACHIIEGVEPESLGGPMRFALYFKIHHALVDGVAAMRLVQKSLSTSPTEVLHLPLWALVSRKAENIAAIMPRKRTLRQLLKEQISTLKPVAYELKNSLAQRQQPDYVKTTQAPSSILNQRIAESRQFLTVSYPLRRLEDIAATLHVSLNDMMLALCAGALRRYLLALNELPSKPLIAFVPISLRQDDSAVGNQTSLVLCNLGTHLTNPKQRLQSIHASMQRGKRLFSRMSQAEVINYSAVAYAWEGVNLLTNAYPTKQAFNVIISNVPGPKEPLYWHGAKLTALYPASVLFDGQALNITVISYLDQINFGIVASDKTLPNLSNLTTFIDQELAVFEQLCLDNTF